MGLFSFGAIAKEVARRMKGFGGQWKRPARADVLKYPSFQRVIEAQSSKREAVTAPNVSPPEAVGDISYVEPGISPECRVFRQALEAQSDAFAEAFMTAPAPGLISLEMRNAHYDEWCSHPERTDARPRWR